MVHLLHFYLKHFTVAEAVVMGFSVLAKLSHMDKGLRIKSARNR